jgi:small GTP-binding protein
MLNYTKVTKKICVIGDAAVGKTSLIKRFIKDEFDDKYLLTIGVKVSTKDLKMELEKEEIDLTLQIWDIVGQSGFSKIQNQAYDSASGALLVLDLSRKETLKTFDLWLSSLYKIAGEVPVVVLANKNDLEPEFGNKEIEEKVIDYGFPYCLTSAKTGENVNEAFNELGDMMIRPWEAVKSRPKLELSNVLERNVEIEPAKNLTALEAEDEIVARYCKLINEPDLAMDMIREIVNKVEIDFKNPTPEDLSRVVNYLIHAASERVDAKILENEKRDYMDLIDRINKNIA